MHVDTKGSWRAPINTWPGGSHMWVAGSKQWVDPFNLQIEQVTIEDIALALSNMCRYTGHVRWHLSVAEHSVQVSARVARHTSDPNILLAALLHDAGEAYLSDVPKPIKDRPEMAWFRDLEDHLLFEVIYPRFGIVCTPNSTTWDLIKTADRDVFNDEWESNGGYYDAHVSRDIFMRRFNDLMYLRNSFTPLTPPPPGL
jgi:hypothetical protein